MYNDKELEYVRCSICNIVIHLTYHGSMIS